MSSDELYVKRCFLNKVGEVAYEVRFEGREDVLPLERILNLTHMTALFADINAKATWFEAVKGWPPLLVTNARYPIRSRPLHQYWSE